MCYYTVAICATEWFFWYRPTRVVPDKRPLNGCCCCCIQIHTLTHSLTHRLRPRCWRWTARRRLNGRARWRQSPAARRTTEARGRSAGNVTEGDEGLHLRCTTSSRPEVPTSCTSLRPLPPAHDGATAGCLHIQPNQFPGDIHIHTHTRFGAQPVSASEPKLNIRLITTIITTTTLIERPLFHDKLGKPVPDR